MKTRSLSMLLTAVLTIMMLFGGVAESFLSKDGITPYVIGPGDPFPDYLTTPNWAYSPPLRKFRDTLPELTSAGANNLGQYIPIATPDIVTYPGSDYYVIELRQFSEKMHTDLANPTKLRGYVQANNGTAAGCADPSINPSDPANCTVLNNTVAPDPIHYLGPLIIAQRDRPVRVLFRNKINPGVDGDLFLPVDGTIMGSGPYTINYDPIDKTAAGPFIGNFSTNRATLHLHGGRSPWISDGTPHQWITPAGEDPNYPQGVSVENVPDMPLPARDSGEQTFFWTNQQSARMMFYHDHAWGITRLNVYAGEAAGLLIQDDLEAALVNGGTFGGRTFAAGTIPADQIPLVIQDKTFVDTDPTNPTFIGRTDPTWNWGTSAVTTSGVVYDLVITNGGSGYASVPTVTITGTGAGAAATAVVTGGVVTDLILTNGGSGYTAPVTVTILGTGNPTVIATAEAKVIDVKGVTGDLWWPHVYMPAQNPFDITGIAPLGRWAYGPYFWPATNNPFQPVVNPYYNEFCDPSDPAQDEWNTSGYTTINGAPFCQAPEIPSTPNPSWGAEAFMDTPVVNGTAYPVLNLDPKPYRLRILNAAHDRFQNLSLFLADSLDPNTPVADDPATPMDEAALTTASDLLCATFPNGCATKTEVRMLPAVDYSADPTWPTTWPADVRPGGIPDWTKKGPDWIVIGNEGGFLPQPVIIPAHPVNWNVDVTTFNAGNVNAGSLILAPAERADVIVDFSDPKWHGKTLILYNDAPAPWPALDPHYDYYTGSPDNTDMGGYTEVFPGFGPNIRTIMQINICIPGADGCAAAAGPVYDTAPLFAAFTSKVKTTGEKSVFQLGQDPIIVGQGNINRNADPAFYETFVFDTAPYAKQYDAYNKAYDEIYPSTYPNWGIARINDKAIHFKSVANGTSAVEPYDYNALDTSTYAYTNEFVDPTIKLYGGLGMRFKAIQDEQGETFDDFGRMRAALGIENISAGAGRVNFIVQTYNDPSTEILAPGETQVWKITHNGVDTHPIHFHLFDVQVLNRVGWDGFIRLPDPTELGWKETVRISPLEDTIVALKPVKPDLPFGIPTSYRPKNPARPTGALDMVELTPINPYFGTARDNHNEMISLGWEYVWHCHILSHEENDMMRPIIFNVPAAPLTAPVLSASVAAGPQVILTWTDPVANAEIGFRIERCTGGGCGTNPANFAQIGTALANATTFADATVALETSYSYRVFAYNAAGDSAPSNTATPLFAFSISGTVTSGGLPLSGVSIALTGAATANTTTNASGVYTFTSLANGSYTVTPSQAGFTFTPVSRAVVINNANVIGQDFVGTPIPPAIFSISGTVTSGGLPLSGVSIALTGAATANTTTNASGVYTFTGLANGSYTVTPSQAGFTFTPVSRAVVINNANVIGQDFVGTPIPPAIFSISGTVRTAGGGVGGGGGGGTPIAGVTVTLGGAATGTTTTNASGVYTFTGLANGSYTVTPSQAGFTFTPVSRAVTINNANVIGQDFTRTVAAATFLISGTVRTAGGGVGGGGGGGTPIAGVTVTLGGAATGTTTTNASGVYTFTGLANGSYTVTPSQAGFTFTPVSRAVTINNTTMAGQNFTRN